MTLTLKDIPEHPHLMSVAQVAKYFGITKTAVYYKVYNQERFKQVYRIGGDPDDPHGEKERPFLLLLRSEVEMVKAAEEAAKVGPSHPQKVNEWNKRVKAWGRGQGYSTVNERGRPNKLLTEAYITAHPDDPRPEPGAV